MQENNGKERTANKKLTEFGKQQNISEFFACDNLNYPSVVENSASAMLDVSRESVVHVNKEKYEGEQKRANV